MSQGSASMWLKMIGTAVVLCVGGPALVQSIRPSNEELFKRYNPELQKRSLEEGDQRARDFDDYVTRLKEWSKSDKSIWIAAKEQEEARAQAAQQKLETAPGSQRIKNNNDETRIQREEMRKELLGEK